MHGRAHDEVQDVVVTDPPILFLHKSAGWKRACALSSIPHVRTDMYALQLSLHPHRMYWPGGKGQGKPCLRRTHGRRGLLRCCGASIVTRSRLWMGVGSDMVQVGARQAVSSEV